MLMCQLHDPEKKKEKKSDKKNTGKEEKLFSIIWASVMLMFLQKPLTEVTEGSSDTSEINMKLFCTFDFS